MFFMLLKIKGSYYLRNKMSILSHQMCEITGGCWPKCEKGGSENPPKKCEIIFERPLVVLWLPCSIPMPRTRF